MGRCGAQAWHSPPVNTDLPPGDCHDPELKSGGYRLYSRKRDPKTGKRRNLGTFKTLTAAERHEREVQYFKRQG